MDLEVEEVEEYDNGVGDKKKKKTLKNLFSATKLFQIFFIYMESNIILKVIKPLSI